MNFANTAHAFKLPGQPFLILAVLLERASDVVTREELRRRMRPVDTFVDFEHGLNNSVKKLRAVLGDSADAPRFVETLPNRGYRFIGHIDTITVSNTVEAAPAILG